MIKSLSLLVSLVSINGFAADLGTRPNFFTCKGADNTTVTYSTTSKIGTPQLNVEFDGVQAKLSRSEIKSQPTLVGTLVTATDNHLVPVDGPLVRYTLVVPTVALSSVREQAKFESVVVKTSLANRVFGPRPGAAVIENNEFAPVECTAQVVFF